MFSVPSEVFLHVSEPVVICRGGSIAFANSGALELLGAECLGKSAYTVFGPEICESQVSSFMADTPVTGRHHILHISRHEGTQIIFFSPLQKEPLVINDAFICSLRNQVMSMNISADMLRARAEELGDRESLNALAAMTRSYYSVSRLLGNTSMARCMMGDGIPFAPCHIMRTQSSIKRFTSG